MQKPKQESNLILDNPYRGARLEAYKRRIQEYLRTHQPELEEEKRQELKGLSIIDNVRPFRNRAPRRSPKRRE
jgi:hypothetical protein